MFKLGWRIMRVGMALCGTCAGNSGTVLCVFKQGFC